MKKFLTVLLALSVVFTYTVGTAFAALDTDAASAAKSYVDQEAAKYLDGDFEQAAKNYVATLTFDKNDRLIAINENWFDKYPGLKSKASKTVVEAAANALVDDATVAFTEYIANYKNTLVAGDSWDKDVVIADVKGLYDRAVNETFTDSNVLGGNAKTVISKQYEIDKEAATAELSKYDATKYSNDKNEWSIKITNSLIATGAPAGYTLSGITGKAAGTELTAREFVEAVVATQTAAVGNALTGSNTIDYANAIGTMDAALDKASVAINGHKITADENYYVEAVPTIEDLTNDTSLEGAKEKAITQLKAAIAYKSVELQNKLEAAIKELDKQASLTTAQKEQLAKLNEAKSELNSNLAAAEEVMVARINYCTTTKAVQDKAASLINMVNAFDTDSNGYITLTNSQLARFVKVIGWVADIKAEAALRAEQKDVNGKPYYDQDVLKANLEEAVEYLYTDTSATYEGALAKLSRGFESSLIDAKIAYIDFINGTKGSLTPVDSKNKKVTEAWNKVYASAENAASGNVAVMAKGTSSAGYAVDPTYMYDSAQRDALTALIDKTEDAIEAATSIPEIEKIFAAAHDEYVAIATTKDHLDAWKGTVGLAYNNANYDKELAAYAQYFVDKATKLGTINNYPPVVRTEEGIMENVVYPIIFEAYTADELADKVAEAKAAVDKILTTEQVKEQRKAVEALISKIPTTVALTDKDVIMAAADALSDYKDIPGSTTDPINKTVLENAKKSYEALAADELDAAYKALKDKKITTAHADAIAALRDLYDAHDAFCDDYDVTSTATTTEANVKALEAKLLEAQVAAARELMIKLPANPTEKDRAAVEAARAAYEALSLEGKAMLVDSLAYDNLIDAEEALGENAIAAVEALKITASSVAKKGSITVKWTVKGDTSVADGFQVYRSLKMNSGFGTKAFFTTTDNTKRTYKNTKSLKKGTRYYYKIRAYKVVDGKTYYSDWSNKAYRIAK